MILLITLFIVGCLLLHVRYKMGYKWSHIFSPTRWKAVYSWFLKKEVRRIEPDETNRVLFTPNDLLQYANRVAMCEPCVLNGKCLSCNCDIGGAMSDKNLSCSEGKWGPMMTEEEMTESRKIEEYNYKKKNI